MRIGSAANRRLSWEILRGDKGRSTSFLTNFQDNTWTREPMKGLIVLIVKDLGIRLWMRHADMNASNKFL